MPVRPLRLVALALFWTFSCGAYAQAPAQTPAQTFSQPPAAAAPSQPALSAAQLDQLVSPIALYPDPLLAQVLIAATYPLEVVQADRWAKNNKNLKGDALRNAVAQQPWDDSLKALVEVPDVLAMMNDKLDWTQKLGDAMLAQQADVMDAVQRLRQLAKKNNKLETTTQQVVSTQSEGGQDYITIQPASQSQIYVPYYEPAAVYGDWPYPEYPPYYFAPPYGYFPAGALARGIAWAAAIGVGWGIWNNCNWGGRYVNHYNRTTNNFTRWEHNVDHRHGVRYNNDAVRQKYAKTDIQAGRQERMDFRGRDGERVVDPGRPGAGDRPGAGNLPANRPGAGNLPANRPGGGADNRPGGGDRPGQGAGNRPGGGQAQQLPAQRPGGGQAQRPQQQPRRDTAMQRSGSGQAARQQSSRGQQSYRGGGGGARQAGGGGGRGGGGGGRRSDIALKHDITLLGRLDNGLGFYRFVYNDESHQAYVGVMAQEVQTVEPDAVVRGSDGYLRVFYDKLGLTFQTYDEWIASGARIPSVTRPDAEAARVP
jgi:hypothetical protein